MANMEFHVCWNSPEASWAVRLGDEHYGIYLSKEQALLDAVDAARDAQTRGDDAQVWDSTEAARVF
jgi:hypothetical protein